jgi:hypothetical protein
MAKGQRRSNREAKKPKQPKSEKKNSASSGIFPPERNPIKVQKDR